MRGRRANGAVSLCCDCSVAVSSCSCFNNAVSSYSSCYAAVSTYRCCNGAVSSCIDRCGAMPSCSSCIVAVLSCSACNFVLPLCAHVDLQAPRSRVERAQSRPGPGRSRHAAESLQTCRLAQPLPHQARRRRPRNSRCVYAEIASPGLLFKH